MKKFTQYFIVVFVTFFFNLTLLIPSLNSQELEVGKKKVLESVLHNTNSMGKYFIIALPPNENKSHPTQIAAIYIASKEKTKVKLISPDGKSVTKICEPFKTITFSSLDSKDLFDWDAEVWESEKIEYKGWSLESEKPVSVYVINSKSLSTDGYMAIPVAQWGNDYFHCSYWDFKEFSQFDWAGGFVIMASEDSTKIDIQLNGRGKGIAKTREGRNIGDRIKLILNKGEVYSVAGDGQTRGGFDLSGSRVTSDKPIGIISFHHRCMIPYSEVTNGRNAINEAMPPVKSWGKSYATIELDRGTDKGDYFRAMAAEDNTKISLKWYDRNTKKQINATEVTLQKAGDFYEFYQTAAAEPHNFPSVRGTSVWVGDKPFLLTQYAYSTNWDNNGKFDPMLILVTPEEQYAKSTIFQTPKNSSSSFEFTENFFNLVAIGDTLDPKRNQELLNSIFLDGTRIVDLTSGFVLNRIPGTNKYWTRVRVTPGSHYIYGDTPFGAYIYGNAQFDSYGWPAAADYKILGEIDTLKPISIIKSNDGEYEINVTELRNGNISDNPRQVETGVGQKPEFTNKTYNFDTISYGGNTWQTYPAKTDFTFYTKVIDKNSDAYAEIKLVDDANNDTTITLSYKGIPKEIPLVVNFSNKVCDSNIVVYETVFRDYFNYNWTINGKYELISNDKNIISLKWIDKQLSNIKLIRENTITSKFDTLLLEINVETKPNILNNYQKNYCKDDIVNIDLEFEDINSEFLKIDVLVFNNNAIIKSINFKDISTSKVNILNSKLEKGSYNIKYYYETQSGCSDTISFDFTINSNALDPKIVIENELLVINNVVSKEYIWYRNDTIVQVGPKNTFKPILSGIYKSQTIDTNNCISEFSNEVPVFINSIESKNDIFIIKSTTKYNLVISNINQEQKMFNYKYQIFDIKGNSYQFIIQTFNNETTLVFNQPLSNGTYFLNLNDGKEKQIYKYIINE